MNLKKLNEKKSIYQNEMEVLLNNIKAEERAFTDEENARFTELEKKIELILNTVAALDKERELNEVVPKEEKINEEQRAIDIETREIQDFANYIRSVTSAEQRADSNLTNGNNGAIVPTTIANKIISTAYDISPVLQKATKYNTKGKLAIPVYGNNNNTDLTMAYADEFSELESKIGKFTAVELNNYLAGALAKLSNSLINNTDIDIVNKVIELMAETVAKFMEGEVLKGTTGKVKGCSEVTLTVTTASSSVITADELIRLKNKVKKTFRKNSMWIMSNETLTAIELLKDDNGRFLFTEDLTGEFNGKFLGYPVYASDNMDEIEAGKIAAFFGDFSGLAVKQTKALEIQVLREKYATQHATGIVAWTEFDSKVEHFQKIAKLVIAE